jgi:hypothetical protein
MNALLASNVISGGQAIWIVFVAFGIPALLVVGAVALIVWGIKNKRRD